VIKNFLYISGGNVFRRVITFFSQLILARNLGEEAFGDLAVAVSIFLLMAGLGDLGTRLHAWREVAIADDADQEGEAVGLLLSRITLAIIMALLLNVVIAVFATGRVGYLLHLYTMVVVFNQTTFDWFLLAQRRFRDSMLFSVGGALLYLAGILFLVTDASRIWLVPVLVFASYVIPGAALFVSATSPGARYMRRRLPTLSGLWTMVAGNRQLLVYDLLQRGYLVAIVIVSSWFYSAGDIAQFQVPYLIYTFVVGLGVYVASGIFEKVARDIRDGRETDTISRGVLLNVVLFVPAGVFGADVLEIPITRVLSGGYSEYAAVLHVLVAFMALPAVANFAREVAVSAGDKHLAVESYLVTVGAILLAVVFYHPPQIIYLAWVVLGAEALGLLTLLVRSPRTYVTWRHLGFGLMAYLVGLGIHWSWQAMGEDGAWSWGRYSLATAVTTTLFLVFLGVFVRRSGLASAGDD
jgi:O-antigen/teichoic acid export membrane protein